MEIGSQSSMVSIFRRQRATYYVDMLKSIHAVEAEDGELPDMREIALDWTDFVLAHIPKEQGSKLRALIEAVPKQNTLMHGDYHTNNIMIQNGEPHRSPSTCSVPWEQTLMRSSYTKSIFRLLMSREYEKEMRRFPPASCPSLTKIETRLLDDKKVYPER